MTLVVGVCQRLSSQITISSILNVVCDQGRRHFIFKQIVISASPPFRFRFCGASSRASRISGPRLVPSYHIRRRIFLDPERVHRISSHAWCPFSRRKAAFGQNYRGNLSPKGSHKGGAPVKKDRVFYPNVIWNALLCSNWNTESIWIFYSAFINELQEIMHKF